MKKADYLIRFYGLGILNTIIGMSVLRAILPINYVLAIVLSEISGQVVKLHLHRKFLFREEMKWGVDFIVRYMRAGLASFLIGAIIGYYIHTSGHLNYNIQAIFITIASSSVSAIIFYFSYTKKMNS